MRPWLASSRVGDVLPQSYGVPPEDGDRLFQLRDDIGLVREPTTRLPSHIAGSVVVDEGGVPVE